MKTSQQIRNLSLFAILSVLGATAQAAANYQTPQLAENGSERATERADSLRDKQAQKLAENDGQLKRDSQRQLAEKQSQQLAESDGERSPQRATRGSKLRDEQAPTVAEGGSDRLQLWHQQRSA